MQSNPINKKTLPCNRQLQLFDKYKYYNEERNEHYSLYNSMSMKNITGKLKGYILCIVIGIYPF